MPNEIINSLETVNLKNMTLEGILSNLIGWTLTSGVRLVIGILVIVVGFKIINKVSKFIENLFLGFVYERIAWTLVFV